MLFTLHLDVQGLCLLILSFLVLGFIPLNVQYFPNRRIPPQGKESAERERSTKPAEVPNYSLHIHEQHHATVLTQQ